jgi:hypothetical protein
MTDTMQDTITDSAIAETVDAHLDAYGEPDAARRRELVERAWAPNGTLVDPPLDPATGHDALTRLFGDVQAVYPGHTFRRTTAVDAHHRFARYGWEMVGPDDTAVLAGTDVVELDADGRLVGVVGFFGDLPAPQ